nr:unnamed protein product [Digitaria exilis]
MMPPGGGVSVDGGDGGGGVSVGDGGVAGGGGTWPQGGKMEGLLPRQPVVAAASKTATASCTSARKPAGRCGSAAIAQLFVV